MTTPRVLGKNVLLAKVEKESPKGVLILPDVKGTQKEYQVLAVGIDCKHVQVNNVVILPNYAGQEITCCEKTYLVAPEEQILAIL